MADQNKTNTNVDKTKTGAQAGGKNPPTGGPDLYKPTQPMEGEKKGGQGGQAGQTARDPYPPTNPERPVMGGQEGNIQGQKGGSSQGGQGSQFGGGSNVGGNVAGGAGAIGGTEATKGTTPGLEEEEE